MKRNYFLMMLVTLLFSSSLYLNADNVKNNNGVHKASTVIYTCAFETRDVFNSWTIIDANKDNRTWLYTSEGGYTRCQYPLRADIDNDDWLISPAIALEGGKKYRLKYDILGKDKYTWASLKVYYGQGITVEAQKTNLIADYPEVPKTKSTESVVISPEEDSDYNIGFFSCSKGKTTFTDVTNVIIELMDDNDMQAISFHGQVMPKINKEYSYTVKVKNNGAATQSDYAVQLVDTEGNVLATTEVKTAIETYEEKDIVVRWTPKNTGKVKVKARVVLTGDQLSTNDETPAITINVQPDSEDEWAVIGDGSLLESTPINFYYNTSVSQTIYPKEEIGFSGMIKKIIYSFSNKSGYELVNHPVKIYMASTALADLSEGWIPESQMTLVFEGTIGMQADDGELEIALTTPFIHSGENLCIMVQRSVINAKFELVRFYSTASAVNAKNTLVYYGATEFDGATISSTLNCTANIKILATTAGEGGKIEGNVTHDGIALEGVKILVSPLEGVSSITNAAGDYSFSFVPKGDYTIIASKFDFEDAVRTGITPVNYESTVVDFKLSKRAKYTVSGIVKDANDANVVGAEVLITGYKEYQATTDANGAFTITDVYEYSGYNIKITKSKLITYSEILNVVDAPVVLNIKLTDVPNPPLMVAAVSSDVKVDIDWKEPTDLMSFRHDDGIVSGQLGYSKSTYLENSVIGSVYKTPTVLTGMSWWTVGKANAGGPHNKVNVFVFDLDSKGVPTSTVLFQQMNVPNKDDQWSSYTFPTHVECPNGFMVAISYYGYAGVGRDTGVSEEYPFVKGGSYVSVNYEVTPFTDILASNMSTNIMVRAEGNPIKKSRSLQGYKVWRLAEADQADESKWTLLTPTSQTTKSFTDNSWSAAATGSYKYAVKAVYTGDILSAPYLSNMVSKGMTANVTVSVKTNTTANEATGAIVTLTNNDNNATHVYIGTVADGKVIIPNVWKGIYTVNVALGGFKTIEKTGVNLTTETPLLTYNLEEMTVTPYNLEIVKADIESERTLNWNKGNIEDDFERHEDFAINSAGAQNWSYIDGDEVTTVGLRDYMFTNMSKAMAFIVFNPSTTTPEMSLGMLPDYSPHSGNKYLASFPLYIAPVPHEDFLISPELSFSVDFTFSFWATGFDGRIKVGYSTTGKEKTDFTEWLTKGNYQATTFGKWVKYSYVVPAEAKYVTIECVSPNSAGLHLDDIFIGVEPSKAMAKYEIYLDGEKIAEESNTYHKFTGLSEGKHTAGVKAIYTSGATEMSTIEFEVDIVGVEDVNALSLNIYPNPVKDMLSIEGEYHSLEIYNTAGTTVLTASGETQINVSNLSKGVYIIKAYNGNKVGIFKIVK